MGKAASLVITRNAEMTRSQMYGCERLRQEHNANSGQPRQRFTMFQLFWDPT